MTAIELFLSPADDGGQTLEEGLDPKALDEIEVDKKKANASAKNFRPEGGDANNLAHQNWGVMAPDTEHGRRLVEVIKPLIMWRQAEMKRDVEIHYVPTDMDGSQAIDWTDNQLIGNNDPEDIPGYMLVLGDLDGISVETQQVLSGEHEVGRLAFDKEEQYEAYIDKVLKWEKKKQSGEARALFFSAVDGTAATEMGDELLIRPLVADAEAQRKKQRLYVSDLDHILEEDPVDAGSRLLDVAAMDHPSILFSCSHGMGAPRSGWNEYSRQRAVQGALCLGDGEVIDAGTITEQAFLPGGMWMFFACFGAGTPKVSEYRHWLSRLKKVGQFRGNIDGVLTSLPKEKDPPFVAALPKAALANPNGPLSVIGHIDLAWSYSFQPLDGKTAKKGDSRFRTVVRNLSRGYRSGMALRPLMTVRGRAKRSLIKAVDEQVRAAEEGREVPDIRQSVNHKWMEHQDLNGYVLLGDPAARMSVNPEEPERTWGKPIREVLEIRLDTSAPAKPAGAEPEVPVPAASEPAEAMDFGLFGGKDKDDEDKDKEPGFLAKLTQKVTKTLSDVMDDALVLEVTTYTGTNVQAAPGSARELADNQDIKLVAHTRSKFDGDMEMVFAKQSEDMSSADKQLWDLHLEMVKQAQAHRRELLQIMISLFKTKDG